LFHASSSGSQLGGPNDEDSRRWRVVNEPASPGLSAGLALPLLGGRLRLAVALVLILILAHTIAGIGTGPLGGG